ncbi:hypothetical protein F2P45_14765 [Massilia sp. CCM 8733]|uniref:Uncharacterized protein n=1 Tax=Massilia mucilaginosa TaxID=2609282 RepID=A0ABX0NU42_9BURK|nr:hypothetical protein [Massilia mucilaginosa]
MRPAKRIETLPAPEFDQIGRQRRPDVGIRVAAAARRLAEVARLEGAPLGRQVILQKTIERGVAAPGHGELAHEALEQGAAPVRIGIQVVRVPVHLIVIDNARGMRHQMADGDRPRARMRIIHAKREHRIDLGIEREIAKLDRLGQRHPHHRLADRAHVLHGIGPIRPLCLDIGIAETVPVCDPILGHARHRKPGKARAPMQRLQLAGEGLVVRLRLRAGAAGQQHGQE